MNRVHIKAAPERAFAVLADAERYPDWVVGASHVSHVDPDFPAPGARFRHHVGVGPLSLSDHTEALAVDPPRRIVLKALARLAETDEGRPAGAGSLHVGRGAGSIDGGRGGRRGLAIRAIEARDALERRLGR